MQQLEDEAAAMEVLKSQARETVRLRVAIQTWIREFPQYAAADWARHTTAAQQEQYLARADAEIPEAAVYREAELLKAQQTDLLQRNDNMRQGRTTPPTPVTQDEDDDGINEMRMPDFEVNPRYGHNNLPINAYHNKHEGSMFWNYGTATKQNPLGSTTSNTPKFDIPKPSKFGGTITKSIPNPKLWLKKLVAYCDKFQQDFVFHLPFFVEGDAEEWVDGLYSVLHKQNKLDRDSVIAEFNRAYGDGITPEEDRALDMLHEGTYRMNSTERVHDFTTRFRSIVRKIGDMPENQQVKWYIEGLTEKLRYACKRDEDGNVFTKLDTVILYAFGQEAKQKAMYTRTNDAAVVPLNAMHVRGRGRGRCGRGNGWGHDTGRGYKKIVGTNNGNGSRGGRGSAPGSGRGNAPGSGRGGFGNGRGGRGSYEGRGARNYYGDAGAGPSTKPYGDAGARRCFYCGEMFNGKFSAHAVGCELARNALRIKKRAAN